MGQGWPEAPWSADYHPQTPNLHCNQRNARRRAGGRLAGVRLALLPEPAAGGFGMAVADGSLDGTRFRLRQITAEVYASGVREIRNIGTGSFGSALLVEVTETRERLVAKKISLEHLADGDRDRALNEAALLRSLRHPNITEYFGSFVSANTLHILMEFCSGGSLQQVLSRRERNEEVFDEEEVTLTLAVPLAVALARALALAPTLTRTRTLTDP